MNLSSIFFYKLLKRDNTQQSPYISETGGNVFMKSVIFCGGWDLLDDIFRQAVEIKSNEDGGMVGILHAVFGSFTNCKKKNNPNCQIKS
jgi:hypothetical protein